MIDVLGEIGRAVGRISDAASATGTIMARLAWARVQVPTYTSKGNQIAPVAGTLLADTNQLAAKVYRVEVYNFMHSNNTAASERVSLVQRNAANTVDNWELELGQAMQTAPAGTSLVMERETPAANERYVLRVGGVNITGTVYYKLEVREV